MMVEPNVTLATLRDLFSRKKDGELSGHDAYWFAWTFNALDQHLCRGGQLPKEWAGDMKTVENIEPWHGKANRTEDRR